LVSDILEPWIGLYLPVDFQTAFSKIDEYRSLLDEKIHIISFYQAWGDCTKGPDLDGIHQVIENGFIPMLTWEPWQAQQWPTVKKPAEQPEFALSSILKGKFNTYIRDWAHELKKLKYPIFFRPMHEMNGNWYPWCEAANGNKHGEYANVWRHLRSIFREAHTEKLVWVFSPYAHSVPDQPNNQIKQFYPGNQEVDWFGLDGYNWGTSQEWSKWQNFSDIFRNSYDCLTKLAPDI
jgi:mannan endo-1,4-beta-mannosidase